MVEHIISNMTYAEQSNVLHRALNVQQPVCCQGQLAGVNQHLIEHKLTVKAKGQANVQTTDCGWEAVRWRR